MGVDVDLSLPPNVRVQDVASIIGALLGCRVVQEPIGRGSLATRVLGVNVVGIHDIPQCAYINVVRADEEPVRIMYHFEDAGGRRCIKPRSTATNIALCVELAYFFGGVVDFQDCDSEYRDIVVPDKPDDWNCPDDGDQWHTLQERIAIVKPMTRAQIARWKPHAAY